jgi:hypothetical protein
MVVTHCLDIRQTDGGEVVSLTHWPLSTHQKNFVFLIAVSG